MSEKIENPTAFPQAVSLRDYFAAAALPSAISICTQAATSSRNPEAMSGPIVAAYCYEIADAMLIARMKGQTP